MTARFTWKLLFQSGLLNKQELHLPDGIVTMGSGSEWDIDMLGAMHTAEKGGGSHIELHVNEEGVSLYPLDMRCTVDDSAVKSAQLHLEPGQTVEVAGCTFILERVGEETAASALEEGSHADEWDALGTDEPSIYTESKSKHRLTGERSAEKQDHADQSTQMSSSGIRAKAATGAKRWFRVLSVALPGSLAAIMVLALAYASQELRASVVHPSESFSVERYQESLSQAGLSTVQIERDKSGTVKLSGSCWDSSKFQPFLGRLTASGIAYQNEVLCQDDLRRSVTYVLQAYGYPHVRVTSGSRLGAVVIAGNIRADARWKVVTKQLNKLHGLVEWSVHNDTEQSLSGLIATLRERGLLSKLSLSRQDDVLTVTGQLDEAQRQALEAVLRPYETASAKEPTDGIQALGESSVRRHVPLRVIYQNIPVLKQEAGIFPAPIVSFSGNKRTAALQLANGVTVQSGSALPSGYTITRLDETGIELQKEGQLVHFPLGL